MTLEGALLQALMRLPGRMPLRSPGLRVTVEGSIEVEDAGPYERVLGPLLIDSEEFAPVLAAFREQDLKAAAAAFEVALARSYGAGRVDIMEVARLDIEPGGTQPR